MMCKCVDFVDGVRTPFMSYFSLYFFWTWANFLLKYIGPSCVHISFSPLFLLNTLDLHVSIFFTGPCPFKLERVAMNNMELLFFCEMDAQLPV